MTKTQHLFAVLILQSLLNGFAQTAPTFTPASLDLSFDAGELTRRSGGPWFTFLLEDMALGPDGKVYIVGHFDRVQGLMRDGVARFDAAGRLDSTFRNPYLASAPERSNIFSADLHHVFIQENADLLVGYGCFSRLKPDGLIDPSLKAGLIDDWLPNCLSEVAAVLPNGNIIGHLMGSAEDALRVFRPDEAQMCGVQENSKPRGR